MNGTSGADTLTGGSDADTLNGLDGNDILSGLGGNDTLDGGSGSDRAWYADDTAAVTVDLNILTAQATGGSGTDTLISIENITGTVFDDVLTGDGNSNRFDGGNGADTLYGGANQDYLSGGSGDDRLYGGSGTDNLEGGKGADLMWGGSGDDTFYGGEGVDTVSYSDANGGVSVDLRILIAQATVSAGSDTISGVENLTGSDFNDFLYGDGGDNRLDGGLGNDDIYGNDGADVLLGGSGGRDALDGGAGNDTLYGGDNRDTLAGGAGDDTLYGGTDDDTLDGGDGFDVASYLDSQGAVTIDLHLTLAQNTVGAGSDRLTTIEGVVGSAFADTLTGDTGDNMLDGSGGNDTLDGSEGIDTLYGGAGTDTLYGGAGTFADYLYGGAGNDTLDGGKGDDLLLGGLGDDIIAGGAGNDTASYDDITGAGVTVSLLVSGAQNTGTGGVDTLTSIENLIGTANNDTLSGNADANRLYGGLKADNLYGGFGDDQLYGGGGNDSLFGGEGRDGAWFGLASTAATWTQNGDGSWAVNAGAEGIDTLNGIEVLHFTDRDIVLTQAAPSDFDQDSKSDVLWRNDNGELYVWISQDGVGSFLGQSLGNPGTQWHVQNVADYDGDGKADVLWRDNHGDLFVYRSDDGGGVSFTGQSISYVDPVWAVVPDTGDFDGDGRADILFRNSDTGEVYLWNSNTGSDISFLGQTLGVVGAEWSIKAVDDFNGDGKADILWRNTAGDVFVWNATGGDGAVSMAGQSISSVPNDWSIIGSGDFNGDGRADILWRHAGDGELYVWNSQTSSTAVNFVGQSVGVVSTDWAVAAIGDYDNDGRADVLFRNADGRVYVWNSNDSGAVGFVGQGLGQTPNDWHILHDGYVL